MQAKGGQIWGRGVKCNGSGSSWASVTLTLSLEKETEIDSVDGQEDSRYSSSPRGLKRSVLCASVRAAGGIHWWSVHPPKTSAPAEI